MDFYIAIGSLIAAMCLYTWLVVQNYKRLIETKPQRLEARRLERKMRRQGRKLPKI